MKLDIANLLYKDITPSLEIKDNTIKLIANMPNVLHIFPNKTAIIKTGVTVEVEALEHCICNPTIIPNYPTYLSTGYNKEVVVLITNYTESTIKINPNEYIADLVINKNPNLKKVKG